MSKFNDLCAAYKTSRDNYFSYRDESYSFAFDLTSRLRAFLEIPDSYFKVVPLTEARDDNKTYTVPGAIHLDDDAYWTLGVRITVFSAPNEFPHQALLLALRFRGTESGFRVLISSDDTGHIIHPGNEAEFDAFFDFVVLQIQTYLAKGIQDYQEQSAPMKTIGFHA